MSNRTTIILADDHAMVRGTLRRMLDSEPDMRVVGAVGNAADAVAEAARLKPQVVLLDIEMPGMQCFEAARMIPLLSPETRVVILSAFFHDRYIEQALAARAWGYIVKNESEEMVVQAIRKVVSGISYYSSEVRARLVFEQGVPCLAAMQASPASTLTDREVEVLRFIARGMSKKEISSMMHISVHTVHRHTTNLMKKLSVHDRVELARFAIREGLAEV